MNTELLETEGVVHSIQMNRWMVPIEPGDIEGQDEQFPIPGKDYILQMVVSLDYKTENADANKIRHTLKRIGGWKLITVPQESLETKIGELPDEN